VQFVGQHAQALFLVSIEVEFATHLVQHLGAVLGDLFCAQVGIQAMRAVAAGREAAHQNGDAEQANEGTFNPGFHDSVSYLKKGLNKDVMLPQMGSDVLSARYRFVSVCFKATAPAPTLI
jgi:hypothetical protein